MQQRQSKSASATESARLRAEVARARTVKTRIEIERRAAGLVEREAQAARARWAAGVVRAALLDGLAERLAPRFATSNQRQAEALIDGELRAACDAIADAGADDDADVEKK